MRVGSRCIPESPAARTSSCIPEIPFTIETVCERLRERAAKGKKFSLVVVAEGVKLPPTDSHGNPLSFAAPRASRFRNRRYHPHDPEEGCARHRAGTHSARRIAQPVRPHSGHALWRRSRGIGGPRRIRTEWFACEPAKLNRLRSMKPSAKIGWWTQKAAWFAQRGRSGSLSEINR